MRKIGMLLILVLVLSPRLYGQTNIFPSSGNVGIGTVSPQEKLTVTGNIQLRSGDKIGAYLQSESFVYDGRAQPHYGMQWITDSWLTGAPSLWLGSYGGIKFFAGGKVRVAIRSNGNIGIGTTSPTHKFQVAGSGKWTGNASSYTEINSNTGGQYIRQYANDGSTQSWLIRGYTSPEGVQAEFNSGGINVNGTIYTKEVNVKANAAEFPDYVFEEGYPLQDLETLKAYIQKEKHLPGIPTSAEVGESGINLYEMNIRLLEKIEELTLYTIAQEEQLKIKQEQFSLLEERLSKLESMLDPKNDE